MSTEPLWVTAGDLKSFTERKEVSEKSDARLEALILLAMAKIKSYCHKNFVANDGILVIPDAVKTATLILADTLAYNDSFRQSSQLKSESYDDYSYTQETSEISTNFDDLDISALLKPYILQNSGNLNLGVFTI